MRDVLQAIDQWQMEGRAVALATVVEVWGSAPRPPGAKMAISSLGEVAGSVSGGCVEAAVVLEAQAVLESGVPRLVRYGVTQEQAWAVGLSCGGDNEIFIERLELHGAISAELRRGLSGERLVALATVIGGPGLGNQALLQPDGTAVGSLGDAQVDARASRAAAGHLARLTAARERFDLGGHIVDVFFETLAPRPKLVVVGAVHVAIPLVRFARTLGFRTIVIDPRGTFATPERFAEADELIVEWPEQALARVGLNETSYIAALAHDLKIDVPALSIGLRSRARYIGVLGSRRTHDKRILALREAGHSEAEIARIRSPIGLDLGGRRPEEIAVAIIAEIVAAGAGRR